MGSSFQLFRLLSSRGWQVARRSDFIIIVIIIIIIIIIIL